MYAPDTILKLKDPRSTGTPGEDDYKPFAYDRVRVVGASPVNHGPDRTKYTGDKAKGVVITPLTNFAGNLDEPFGKLQALYEVESVPEYEDEATITVRKYDASTRAAGPTPEDIFAAEAAGDPSEPRRPGSPTSPLADPTPPAEDGPLGETEAPEAEEPAPESVL